MTSRTVFESTAAAGSSVARGFVIAALRTRRARIGLLIVSICILIFVIGPVVAPYDPTSTGVGGAAASPDADHLLGTDALGRDVFSRLLNGGSDVIIPPLVAVMLATALGGMIGMASGLRGGRFDRIVTKSMEVLMSIPALVLALVIIARWGGSNTTIIATVALVFTPRVAIVMRGAVRTVRLNNYVRAAEARGDGMFVLVIREILPNVTGPMLVEFGIRLTYAVLFVATMNVLGFGAQPPSSNWGVMVADGRQTISLNLWASVAPALAIALLVIGINLIVDSLAQQLDRGASPSL